MDSHSVQCSWEQVVSFVSYHNFGLEHLLEHQQKITPTSRPRGNVMRPVTAHAITVVIELEVKPES